MSFQVLPQGVVNPPPQHGQDVPQPPVIDGAEATCNVPTEVGTPTPGTSFSVEQTVHPEANDSLVFTA